MISRRSFRNVEFEFKHRDLTCPFPSRVLFTIAILYNFDLQNVDSLFVRTLEGI